jgi:hypothetical protein
MGGRCTQQPAGDDAECGEGDECNKMVCSGGSCGPRSANEGDACGGGGTECNPKVCVNGSCQSDPGSVDGHACTGGLCYGGSCCKGGTADGICGIGENRTCCATEPCCGPGSCCVDCFSEPSDSGGPDMPVCCPADNLCPPNVPNSPGCCYDYETCFQFPSGGYGCIRPERICGGTTVCDSPCCGNNCCAFGEYCTSDLTCAPVPAGACSSDAECESGLTCVGMGFDQSGGVVVTPGTCCPLHRACTVANPGGPSNPRTYCVNAAGTICNASGRECSYGDYLACGDSCDGACSPRGGRTRL